ncbi:MAG: hypothetical protein ACTSVA_00175 [Candidatus Njordarchaeales archaeon]
MRGSSPGMIQFETKGATPEKRYLEIEDWYPETEFDKIGYEVY